MLSNETLWYQMPLRIGAVIGIWLLALRIEVAEGLDDLADLRSAWDGLFSTTANRAFYNDWRWHAAVARHLIRDTIYYLQVLDDSQLVAIFPLQLRQRSDRTLPIRYLDEPRHPHIALSDVVVSPEHLASPILRRVLAFLCKNENFRWHGTHLSHTPARSNLAVLCRNQHARMKPTGRVYYVPRSSDSQVPLSAKQLRNTRRLKARAHASFGAVVVETAREPGRILDAFEQFMRIEASGWKSCRNARTAIKLHPDLVDFYRELLTAFSETGEAAVTSLRLGEDLAASNLSLFSDDTIYLLKIGYDETYEAVGPGMILLTEMLDWSAENSFEFNMLTAPRWGMRWHFVAEPVYSTSFYNNTVAGTALRCLELVVDLGR